MYRLEVVTIHLPPLRERMEDIPDLAYYFVRSLSERHGKEIHGIAQSAMDLLLDHHWPGNIRELSNVIERALVFASGNQIEVSDLPPHLIELKEQKIDRSIRSTSIEVPLGTSLREVEDILIRKTLEATSGDKNMTARLLGINSRTIYRKLNQP